MRVIRTFQSQVASRAALAVIGCVFFVFWSAGTVGAGKPKSSPHRFIPSRDLVAFFEFDGLDAHARAWKATAAHAMLADTNSGAMLNEVTRQWAHWILQKELGGILSGADVIAVRDHMVSKGFSLAVHVNAEAEFGLTVVLNGFRREELLDRFRGNRPFLFGIGAKDVGMLEGPIRIRGRSVYAATDDDGRIATRREALISWFEGDDLLIIVHDESSNAPRSPEPKHGLSPKVEGRLNAVFDTVEGKAPNVTSHPRYLAALAADKDLKEFDAIGLFFVGPAGNKGLLTALSAWAPEFEEAVQRRRLVAANNGQPSTHGLPGKMDNDVRLAAINAPLLVKRFDSAVCLLAPEFTSAFVRKSVEESDWEPVEFDLLDALKGLVVRWGFQGVACITDVRIEAPVPRKVLDVVLDQPSLSKPQIAAMPPGTHSFAVGSFDPQRSYQSFQKMWSAIAPSTIVEFPWTGMEKPDNPELRVGADLFKLIGPTWWAIPASSSGSDRDDLEIADPTTYVVLARVNDADAFAKVLDRLASQMNGSKRYRDPAEDENSKRTKHAPSQVKAIDPLPPPSRGYRITAAGGRALGLPEGFEPVIMVGDSLIAIAADADRARVALASMSKAGSSRPGSADLAKAFDGLPSGLTFLAVTDPRDSTTPERMVELPWIVQFLSNTSLESDPKNASAQALLDLVGIARPGGLRLEIKPSQRPNAEDLRAHLFPSLLAGGADARGYRMIAREAFPGALLLDMTKIGAGVRFGWLADRGFWLSKELSVRILGFETMTKNEFGR